MGWLLNLMLGKGTPPNQRSFTILSSYGGPGKPYNISSKLAAGVETSALPFYIRFIARIGK